MARVIQDLNFSLLLNLKSLEIQNELLGRIPESKLATLSRCKHRGGHFAYDRLRLHEYTSASTTAMYQTLSMFNVPLVPFETSHLKHFNLPFQTFHLRLSVSDLPLEAIHLRLSNPKLSFLSSRWTFSIKYFQLFGPLQWLKFNREMIAHNVRETQNLWIENIFKIFAHSNRIPKFKLPIAPISVQTSDSEVCKAQTVQRSGSFEVFC